ncbi:hypothetical protein GCT13_24650 [Paraburkholderia sp. CNPSo 3157]|uniref:SMP-30/Gluconolactonase/LRE-like region domain-containing protein n=1 Tax=Paraburkholderia franconis TaxID=2654983 RepID=A0A7X1NDJ0_9BURK|nr:hypothetical protein [Paraburkholderia franconis]MPW19998.1 hypothetical protein [Paraburkholderia franconis]
MKLALCVAVVSTLFGVQLAHAACPNDAVFLVLGDQIRGYSLRANGATEPCQVLQGPHTTLMTAGATVIDRKKSFHVTQFLTNGTIDIFSRKAEGNEAPSRSFMFDTNDLVSIAVDSHLNDFVMSVRPSTAGVLVALANTSGPVSNPIHITDPTISQYESVAIDSDDNLLVAGYDIQGTAIIDTFGTSRSITAPPLLRSITGPQTGLLSGRGVFFSRNDMSIAVDPRTDELFVYNTSTDLTQIQVSVFAAKANGDVAPVRTISGPATGITGPGLPGNKIAISSDGRLFVAEPNLRILAFAPGARGNVAPSQVIEDSTPGPVTFGGIAVRSGGGGQQNANDDAQ